MLLMEKGKAKTDKESPRVLLVLILIFFSFHSFVFLDVCARLAANILATITILVFSFYILSMARQTILPSISLPEVQIACGVSKR
jgi:hypothetical protein